MRFVFLVILLIVNLIAGEYYTKEIIFEKITKPTLIRVKIDNELYEQMVSNDIRIYSSNGDIENHYIKSRRPNLLSLDSKDGYNISTIPLFSKSISSEYTDYIFKPNGTPADKIIPNIEDKEYERVAKIYIGNREGDWHFLLKRTLKDSKVLEVKDNIISLNSHTNFIRLMVDNGSNNHPLTINSLKIKTAPHYLYFMADSNQTYNVHFTKEHNKNLDTKIANLVEGNSTFIEGRLANLKRNQIVNAKKKSDTKENDDKDALAVIIVLAVVVLLYIAVGFINGSD
ncbi:hypothetical protein MNB_SV-12-1159 [hydrothermal vent metagenome]|uniref:Uncharacterized protein n=1 Tax=hydrothermal vent metagenome TaxID=652676 RepID=A0A1W1CFT0_9ZZZZ